jgi:hypothetical protein
MRMTTFTISIAGLSVQISALHAATRMYCQKYLTEKPADFSVSIEQQDIDSEREKAIREYELEGISVPYLPDAYLETLAVYRKIANKMLNYDTILFHGSAIAVDGEGYLFTATSGTGKSTHTRLWREHFGDRAIMVNDDKPLLRSLDGKIWVCGTPWDGKHRLSTNTMVPLKGICILTRGEKNEIHRIPSLKAISMMLQQCHRPPEAQEVSKMLELIDRMLAQVPVYLLKCNMSPEAAEVSYQGMLNT